MLPGEGKPRTPLSARVATRVSWSPLSVEFPREAGLILRGAVQDGNPFQTTQGNQLSCREQERSRSSEEVVRGLSVFPSRESGMSGNFWMSHEGCQVPCLTSRRQDQGENVAISCHPPRELGFQAWAQSTCPELSAQGLYPNVHRSTVYNSQDMEAT